MTHEYAGRYAAKHPEGAMPDPRVAEALKPKIRDGGVSCAAVHRIAGELSLQPNEIGRTMDLMELKIVKCQMGLFGYTPEKKIVQPADAVPPELEGAITAALENGRLACRTAWAIADRFGVSRMEMAAACEAMAVKVSPCQIGAF
jgi:hypothetical protein